VFSTGDAKLTYKAVADPGWVLANDGTIGKAGSGATTRANADCQALFVLLYSNTVNVDCPVSGGRTGNAVNDFNNGKTIQLPKVASRIPLIAGSGVGLTAYGLAGTTGEEAHVLTSTEMPSHNHSASSASVSSSGDSGHIHNVAVGSSGSPGLQLSESASSVGNISTGVGFANISTSTSTSTSIGFAGSGAAHNNMPPIGTIFMMIKL
jgi:microcystin-dependent protein